MLGFNLASYPGTKLSVALSIKQTESGYITKHMLSLLRLCNHFFRDAMLLFREAKDTFDCY